MADPMTPERPRCGMPCLKHAHSCDRSPGHCDWHRDVQQKGDHTCAWSTPGPKDAPAILAALRSARAEVERLQAKVAKDHDELRDKRTDLLNIRGILSPQPSTGDPVVPMPLGAEVAPAIEWLAAEVERLRAELDAIRTDETDVDWLADHVRTVIQGIPVRGLASVEHARSMIAEQAASLIKAGSAPFISARVVGLAVDHIRRAETERDEAHAELERLRDELVEAQREREQYRTSLPAEVQDYWAWRKRSELVEAERDRLAEQVKRGLQELAAALLTTDGMLIQRDGIAAAGHRERAHGIELGANEIRRIVHRVRVALDGGEPRG